MKTVMEWLEEAKEQGYPWADAAIANCDPIAADNDADSISDSLWGAFCWSESPEGFEFWKARIINVEEREYERLSQMV